MINTRKQLGTIVCCTLLGCALLASAPWPARAADDAYAIWGVGQLSCRHYSADRSQDKSSTYRQYLMGYLTAYNRLDPATYRISGKRKLPDLLVWLDDYCTAHPMDSFENALGHMLLSLYEGRQTSPPGKRRAWGR